jgi:hypothetical protein
MSESKRSRKQQRKTKRRGGGAWWNPFSWGKTADDTSAKPPSNAASSNTELVDQKQQGQQGQPGQQGQQGQPGQLGQPVEQEKQGQPTTYGGKKHLKQKKTQKRRKQSNKK